MTFAALLRRHRRRVGLTQQEMAERAGLSFPTVSDLERGGKLTPRVDTLSRPAEALALEAHDRPDFAAAARHCGRRTLLSAPNRTFCRVVD
jgi:transcriptional regulator with XRE-family HTH domain